MNIMKIIIGIFVIFVMGSVALGLLSGVLGITAGIFGILWGILKAIFAIVGKILFHPVVLVLIGLFIVVKIHDRKQVSK